MFNLSDDHVLQVPSLSKFPLCLSLVPSDNYGFVTYYDTKDAFTAIENGGKLRKPNELPFDLCFGGRRQFCRTSYADLGTYLYP